MVPWGWWVIHGYSHGAPQVQVPCPGLFDLKARRWFDGHKKQAGSMKSWKSWFILCIQELRIKIVYYQYYCYFFEEVQSRSLIDS